MSGPRRRLMATGASIRTRRAPHGALSRNAGEGGPSPPPLPSPASGGGIGWGARWVRAESWGGAQR
jgi:hypothetical protein